MLKLSDRLNDRTEGFTLIEVLVALAVVAIALGAIISSTGTQANSVGYLKQKTIAHWVAMNEITELQIAQKLPSLGTSTGSREMVGADWYWSRDTLATEDENTRQVTYTVFADKARKQNLTVLSGFIILKQQDATP